MWDGIHGQGPETTVWKGSLFLPMVRTHSLDSPHPLLRLPKFLRLPIALPASQVAPTQVLLWPWEPARSPVLSYHGLSPIQTRYHPKLDLYLSPPQFP